VSMAVRLDEDMVAGCVGGDVFAEAERLVTSGSVGQISEVGGGARAAVVRVATDRTVEVWVGVVDGGLSAECDCDFERGIASEELCAHAVAVTLRALRGGFAWSSAATAPSAAVDPEVSHLVTVAERLPHRRLALLVATFAATDRRLRTRLLSQAGQLGPLTDAEATQLRRVLEATAREATTGRWNMHAVVSAGEALISEAEIAAERPASATALLFVEHVAELWDELAAHLYDDWEHYDGVPEEMGERMRRVHLQLCEQLQPDPDELTERLDRIISAAEATSCLDSPQDYLAFQK
jgi:hypothetical protein